MLNRRQLIIGGAAALHAQEPERDRDLTIVTDVLNVVAPVTVISKDGSYVSGLEASDFRLEDNKIPQQIRVDVSFVPISMVVAIQANNVIEPFLNTIKRIGPLLEGLILGTQGEAALLKFDHRIQEIQPFTNDAKLFTKALDKIIPGSSTSAMIDTVFQATRMLRARTGERRRVLLLISETQDKGSEGRIREALLSAQINNIQVYSININRLVNKLAAKMPAPRQSNFPPASRPMPGGMPQTPHTQAQMTGYGGEATTAIPIIQEVMKQVKYVFVPNPLEVLTKHTGGREFSFLTLHDMEETMTKLGEELHAQYLLNYNPSKEVLEQGGWHDIRVTVMRPNIKQVRTRPGYWLASKF
ncbi:MAG: VWA domain-containing protein [Bryobacteraceae bacterium]